MLPGDRLVVAFTEPHKVGDRFKGWFLHVTIVPWFRLPGASEHIAAGLEKALTAVKPFTITAGAVARFGPSRQRLANLVQADSLPEIERRVRHYLKQKRAWLVDETTKTRRKFRPHVTLQGEHHLDPGDKIHCGRLYIVEQKGDYKEVAGEIRL